MFTRDNDADHWSFEVRNWFHSTVESYYLENQCNLFNNGKPKALEKGVSKIKSINHI